MRERDYHCAPLPPIRAIFNSIDSRETVPAAKNLKTKREEEQMCPKSAGNNKRNRNRTKAVLPVRVRGTDAAGKVFEELAHTLDVTPNGARLGAIRRELNLLDEVVIQFRQRRIAFRVIWVKKMKGTSEFQVGLEALVQEREPWGLGLDERNGATVRLGALQASGSA